MKLCKDCKHFDGREYCLRAPNPDYVFGKAKFYHAQIERQWNTENSCGIEGKHFEDVDFSNPAEKTA